ncbi:MAG TPA: lysylphosphatidylglycerol synthase domain-containing protein, partial [Bacteroidales bacterium]|nr:lysylphosphatidylglycerol synthase domain-containing protein [Bacteroidales bacterium]
IYCMNTLAWKKIIGNHLNVNFFQLVSLKISSFALNYITPVIALGGEPWKVMNIKRLIGIERASSSVILYDLMHILSHFFFWTFTLFLIFFTVKPTLATYIVLGVVFIFLISLILIIYNWYKKGIVFSFINFLNKIPFLKKLAANLAKQGETLEEIERQIVEFYKTRRKDFYASLAYEFFARIIGSIEFFLIMQAIQIDINLFEAIYISAATSLLSNLVGFVPMQLGTREGSLYLVYESLKLAPEQGIVVGLATRVREFFFIFVGLILMRINPLSKPIEDESIS